MIIVARRRLVMYYCIRTPYKYCDCDAVNNEVVGLCVLYSKDRQRLLSSVVHTQGAYGLSMKDEHVPLKQLFAFFFPSVLYF